MAAMTVPAGDPPAGLPGLEDDHERGARREAAKIICYGRPGASRDVRPAGGQGSGC